jgi:hypothetical protein
VWVTALLRRGFGCGSGVNSDKLCAMGLLGRVFLSCSICYDDVNVEKRHKSGRLVGA